MSRAPAPATGYGRPVAGGSGARLVAHRALANPAPVAAVAINVLVVCTLVAGLAASLTLLQRDALRSALDLAPPEETVLAVTSPYDDEAAAAQDAAVRAALAPLVDVAGGGVVSLAESGTYDRAGARRSDEGVGFTAIAGADPWLETVDGSLPTAGDGPLEVAAPDGSDLAVGDALTVVSRTDGRRVAATVVGTWAAGEGSQRWLGPVDPRSLLVSPDAFGEVAGTGTLARWRAVPDLDALEPDQLATLSDAVGTTLGEVDAAGEEVSASVQSDTGLVEVLDDRARELTVLRALLLVPAGLLMLVAAAGLVLVAAGLADVRRGEESLLRSRGAGYRQLAAPTVVETLVVCGAAALVAPLLSWAVVRIGDVRPPLDPAAWAGSSLAAGACAVALSIPVVVRAVTGDRGQQLSAERQRRRGLTLLVTTVLVVLGLGALALVTLRGFGDTVESATVRSTSVDPLLVASPALVLLAITVVTSVLVLPPAFRLLATAAASRGVPLAIGARFASRAPVTAVPVALATTLAVGTLAFAAVEHSSSAAARDDRAAYVAGPDARVLAPSGAARAGAGTEQQVLAALPGVEQAVGVHRSTVFLEDLRAEVLVTDVAPRAALFGPEAPGVDVSALTSAGSGPVPVALSEQLATRASLQVGDTLTVTMLGIPTQVEVAATVPYVRTVPDGSGAVLADAATLLPVLEREGFADEPTEWWLDVVDGGSDEVAAALSDRADVAREVVTTAEVLRRLDDDPSTGGAALGQVLLLTGTGCLVVGGLLLLSVVLLRRRERAAQAWMLGTAGAGRRDLLGVLGVEYAVTTAAGVVTGVLAGTLVAAITLVSMTLGPDGRLLVPAPTLVLPWPVLVTAPGAMVLVPLLGMLWLTRRDHARTLDADAPVGGPR